MEGHRVPDAAARRLPRRRLHGPLLGHPRLLDHREFFFVVKEGGGSRGGQRQESWRATPCAQNTHSSPPTTKKTKKNQPVLFRPARHHAHQHHPRRRARQARRLAVVGRARRVLGVHVPDGAGQRRHQAVRVLLWRRPVSRVVDARAPLALELLQLVLLHDQRRQPRERDGGGVDPGEQGWFV